MKAATLEAENQELKTEFKRERFAYIFVIAILFNLFVGVVVDAPIFVFCIIASLILLIGLAKWLEFP